jgi:flagellar hook-associated protein 3 FlgL
MRINPDNSSDLLLMLNRCRLDEEAAIQQLSSGRRAVKPSDDPAAMAAVSQLHRRESQASEFLQSISSLRESLSTADSTLNSVVQGLDRAITLGVEGATATQSAANRQSLAQEIRGIRDQLLCLANTSFRGSYIFAGTAAQAAPFVADSTVPGGVRYDGNSEVDSIEIGDHRLISKGISGDQIFASAGAGVFVSLDTLANALDTNDVAGIQDAIREVRSAFDHVTASRVVYGNEMAQLDSDEQYLNQAKLQIQTRETELIGADPAAAASQLQHAQFARDATLAAAARTQLVSLLDYLQ